jgi:hypothetical protein
LIEAVLIPGSHLFRGGVATVKTMFTLCWYITISSVLMACEHKHSSQLSGVISAEYTGSSTSDVSFGLANIHIRGGRTLSLAIEAWDAGFECKRDPHAVPDEDPIAFHDGSPVMFKVSPGDRARLVIATTFPQQYKGGNCTLRIRLSDGMVVGPFEFRP